jgi:beta-glucanase (GH16 family)
VFAEEFTRSFEPLRWMDQYYWGRRRLNPDTLQWFSARGQNLVRKDASVLRLEARKEATRGVGPEGEPRTYPFSSALLSMGNLLRFQFGRVSVRCRFPQAPGCEGVLWLLSEGVLPEVIIARNVAGSGHTISCDVVTGGNYGTTSQQQSQVYLPGWSARAFHTWELDWRAERLRWYVDGRLVKEVVENVPQAPAYLLLGTNVVNDHAAGQRLNPACYPAGLEVDWVRIYA